jgi:hypothetical protein
VRVAGLIAELVGGGGVDTRLPSQENGEAQEDAHPNKAQVLAASDFLENRNHSYNQQKNKSKGKTQIAKGKSKNPRMTYLHCRIPCWGFTICLLRFAF